MAIESHPFINNKWQANLAPQGDQWFINDDCFGYMPVKDVECIFLGSFPTYEVVNLVRQRGNKEFFYGSVDNNFWHVLTALTGLSTTTEQECFTLLQQVNFGITDILKEVDRNGTSSADNDLTSIQYNSITHLLQHFPNLRTLFVTSGGKSSITNGTSNCVSKWFRDYLLQSGHTCQGFNVLGYHKQITISQNSFSVKQVNLVALITPSDQAWQSLQGFINRNNLNNLLATIPQNLFPLGADTTFNRLRLLQWGYHLRLYNFPISNSIQQIIQNNQHQFQQIFS